MLCFVFCAKKKKAGVKVVKVVKVSQFFMVAKQKKINEKPHTTAFTKVVLV